MHSDYLIYTRRKKFFIWVLVICAFSFNKVHSGNPYGNYNRPSHWEVQQYMNNLRNPVTTTVSESVSITHGLPGSSSSSQDASSEIASLTRQLESDVQKLIVKIQKISSSFYTAFSALDAKVKAVGGGDNPPTTVIITSGGWTLVATFAYTYTVGNTKINQYHLTSGTYEGRTITTNNNTATVISGIQQIFLDEINQLQNTYQSLIAVLLAESTKSDTWDSLSDSGFEPLQPLSSESKFESRFEFNTPGKFNRWIDDLEPGEFKKLGPPFPEKQVEKLKKMKEAADEIENISREKEQQQQQLERIEQDPNLTEEQKEHARQYCDSVTVDLTDKENAVYVGLYGDMEEFDSIEQEGEKSLTTVDVPPIGKYEDAAQVDGTTYDTEEEESEPSDLKILWEGIKGTAKDILEVGAQVGLALADIPLIGDAISLGQAPSKGKEAGEKVADNYFGEKGVITKGVNSCLSGTFDDEGYEDAQRDAAAGSFIAIVKAVTPSSVGSALDWIAKKAKQDRERERGY